MVVIGCGIGYDIGKNVGDVITIGIEKWCLLYIEKYYVHRKFMYTNSYI